ncbi:restriction endonuclease subunit S [Sulfuricurvum sp. IAE1]|uniref:restriction endonuclease subunit S n=1 Tax=Sulfuricurvum sp. IAE1 TaxID=2546102 RepID=UPI001404D660|nr:restriction endonuclease subunit S [Sulfuricurvum sp. IAE1]
MQTWKWKAEYIQPLSYALKRKNIEVHTRDVPLVTIRFGGAMEIRESNSEDIKGKLYLAESGNIVYSKIDVRNGAIGIVPQSIEKAAFTSEFPIYEINPDVAVSEYIALVFQSEIFKKHINAIVSGASGRKRVQPDQLEALEIPIPPFNIQEVIVKRWRESQDRIESAKRAMDDLIREVDELLWRIYGEHAQRDILSARSFALGFGELGSWDLKSSRAAAFAITCPSFREMGEFVEEATELVRPYEDPEKLWPLYGVNNKEGVFLSAMQEGKEFNASYKKVKEGWFFHNPTRCNVGSLGIVPAVPEDAVTSPEYQVWKLRENSELLAGYTALMIRTSFFLALVQFNRVGAVKERMYVDNLKAIRIPVLPLEQQHDFVRRRDEALRMLEQTATIEAEAKAAVEKMIIGG